MKLSRKILLAFAGLLFFMAAASLFGIYRLNQSLAIYANEVQSATNQERAASDLLSRFKTQTQEWKNTLLRGKDPQARDKHWTAFQKIEGEIAADARKLIASLPEGEGKSLVTRFAQAHLVMSKAYAKGFEAFKEAEFDASAGDKAVYGIDREPAKLVDEAANKIAATAATASADAETAGKRATWISLSLMLAVAACGVVGGFFFSQGILRQLGADPADLMAVVQRVTAGDLATPVPLNAGDDTSVMALLGRMQVSLAQVVASVRQNSESVATASAQIAQGNQDLSSRTEQQASALQQTAATMEELGTTVRHNADSAKQANQLAQGASAVAGRGGEVVGQVVATMQGINDSSRKIGDIISVIDGIAFQTNILALNAAVEAARAGEQGRGFAVVASEVRSLAQRSAEAAREIKTLIGRSVERVEQGTVLVDQAGKTMGEIVGSIQRVSDIVAEITSASAEQSSGVQQVCEAVSQMDQATQQNAALVEESAAAAESLKGQALQLVQAVAVFRLSHDGHVDAACVVPLAAHASSGERRGPQRAQNVTRPVFKGHRAAAPALVPGPAAGAPVNTGTDAWTSF
jgi:methyl-accepting chemotaxis protein-1 (serine sensor receptor)